MYYRLDDNHNIVECSLMEWAQWYETSNRIVKQETIAGVKVSTVFLGLDHRFFSEGPPIVFETMIFGGYHDEYQQRYCTWDEAVEGHMYAVALVISTLHRHDQIDALLSKLDEDEPSM